MLLLVLVLLPLLLRCWIIFIPPPGFREAELEFELDGGGVLINMDLRNNLAALVGVPGMVVRLPRRLGMIDSGG